MGDFHCPFIQKYYKPTYVSENPDYKIDQNILMDFCPFHSLNQFLASQNSVLSLPIKIYFLYQISVGLRFLRDLGIVHLDIKP